MTPRSLWDFELTLKPGTCTACGGIGVLLENIDEERHDVTVPCWKCRTFCKACDRYVKKTGHECKGK
jgi:hypothetical protein